jgi:hypothetical protein
MTSGSCRHRYHQQYLWKVPDGYCPDHGTGVSCPVGLFASDAPSVTED